MTFLMLLAMLFQLVIPARPDRLVLDNADMLSAQVELQMQNDLRAYYQTSGNTIFVVTIQSLEGEPLEEYAVKLFHEWRIGDADDTGVLLLISKDDRVMRIEVGNALEGVLTDAASSRIIRNNIAPAFKKGSYESGIIRGVSSIKEELGTETLEQRSARISLESERERVASEKASHFFWSLFKFVVIAGIIFFAGFKIRQFVINLKRKKAEREIVMNFLSTHRKLFQDFMFELYDLNTEAKAKFPHVSSYEYFNKIVLRNMLVARDELKELLDDIESGVSRGTSWRLLTSTINAHGNFSERFSTMMDGAKKSLLEQLVDYKLQQAKLIERLKEAEGRYNSQVAFLEVDPAFDASKLSPNDKEIASQIPQAYLLLNTTPVDVIAAEVAVSSIESLLEENRLVIVRWKSLKSEIVSLRSDLREKISKIIPLSNELMSELGKIKPFLSSSINDLYSLQYSNAQDLVDDYEKEVARLERLNISGSQHREQCFNELRQLQRMVEDTLSSMEGFRSRIRDQVLARDSVPAELDEVNQLIDRVQTVVKHSDVKSKRALQNQLNIHADNLRLLKKRADAKTADWIKLKSEIDEIVNSVRAIKQKAEAEIAKARSARIQAEADAAFARSLLSSKSDDYSTGSSSESSDFGGRDSGSSWGGSSDGSDGGFGGSSSGGGASGSW